MARKVIWSPQARANRKMFFEYWTNHNKSKSFSIKLNKNLNTTARFLSKYPLTGRKTAISNVYIKVIMQFLLIYELKEASITILTIRDGRRNPDEQQHIL